jgi:hypothetical protein
MINKILKISLLLVGVLVFSSATLPVEKNPGLRGIWKTLSKVTFKSEKDPTFGYPIDVPIFSKEVKALAGKTVEVEGYIIPVEGYQRQGYFVFSAYPYNLCYFCGGAGPETVMEVFTKKGTTVKYTAKPITIRGKLVLNSKDVNKLMYLLEDAVLVEK